MAVTDAMCTRPSSRRKPGSTVARPSRSARSIPTLAGTTRERGTPCGSAAGAVRLIFGPGRRGGGADGDGDAGGAGDPERRGEVRRVVREQRLERAPRDEGRDRVDRGDGDL